MTTTYKPKFADVIGDFVNDENINIALDFICYLEINKISTQWTNTNTWKAVKRGTAV